MASSRSWRVDGSVTEGLARQWWKARINADWQSSQQRTDSANVVGAVAVVLEADVIVTGNVLPAFWTCSCSTVVVGTTAGAMDVGGCGGRR